MLPKGLFSAFFYGAISCVATLLQKFVVADRSSSPHPLLLILLQVLAGSFTLPLLSFFGACERPPHLTRNELLRVCLTSLLFFSNVVVGLLSLRILHVSVYNALKRLTTLWTLLFEVLVLGRRLSYLQSLGILVMTAGTMMAGYGDMNFHLPSYSLAMFSCILHAAYLVCVKKFELRDNQGKSLTAFVATWLNSVVCVLPLLIVTIVFVDIKDTFTVMLSSGGGQQVAFWASILQGFVLTWAQFMCTLDNSPLATTVVGQLKVNVSSVIALYLWQMPMTLSQATGLLLNALGAFTYSIASISTTHRGGQSGAALAKVGPAPRSPQLKAKKVVGGAATEAKSVLE